MRRETKTPFLLRLTWTVAFSTILAALSAAAAIFRITQQGAEDSAMRALEPQLRQKLDAYCADQASCPVALTELRLDHSSDTLEYFCYSSRGRTYVLGMDQDHDAWRHFFGGPPHCDQP